MKPLVNKLGQLRKVIEVERGEFTLYALVLPDDAIAWDMLVAADWIDKDQSEALRYLVKKVQGVLTKGELLNLSGIIIGDSDHFPENSVSSETGLEATDIDFYGRHVQKAYIFSAPIENLQISVSQ